MAGIFGFGSHKQQAAAPTPAAAPAEHPASSPQVDLRSLPLDREKGRLLPEAVAQKIGGVCIGQPSDHQLTVVVGDTSEVSFYDLIDMGTDHRFKAQLLAGDPKDIALAQEWVYRVGRAREMESWHQWLETKRFEGESLQVESRSGKSASEVTGEVVDATDRILKEGISLGASDIHLESYDSQLLIRYRQDGVLRTVDEVTDPVLKGAIVKRLKIMAQMDITQGRVTQGGRISLEVGGRGFDLRVSIVPVPAGESVVLRVLNKGSFSTTLSDLGLEPAQLKRFEWFLGHPHGLILTCGPTGAGKSTTLYASLKSIQRPDRKLLTVEDPIEYQMPGITQIQVNTAPKDLEMRVTFASALREFLRHDPDVILVGEIRDEETAHICVQAALTGHLVLSTLHTNDAVGIINRLKDQQVKPYLIASTLVGGMAQRLIRRTCTECARDVEPTEAQRDMLARLNCSGIKLREGAGCARCRNTGFKGRVGLYEVLTISDEIKELIETNATAQQVHRVARSQGMSSLLEDGLAKVRRGQVTLDEVLRVCASDSRTL